MGVNGINKIIKQYCKRAVRETNYREYSGKKIAIDISLTLHRLVIAFRDSNNGNDLVNNKGEFTSHVFGIKNKTLQLLKNGVLPVYVFDGKPPDIKRKTLADRKIIKMKAQEKLSEENLNEEDIIKYKKRTYFIKDQDIREIQELLKYMGIPYVQSLSEAELQCAALNINNKVDAVLTEDWDIILFGCKKMLKSSDKKGILTEIDTNILLNELELNLEQFIELCILLGTDYSSGIKGMNQITLYNEYKKFKNIDKFFEYISNTENKDKYEIPDDLKTNYLKIKNYYMNANIIDPNSIEIKFEQPNMESLKKLLIDKYNFNEGLTTNDLINIQLYYNNFKNGIFIVSKQSKINYSPKTFNRTISAYRYNRSLNRNTYM